MVEIYANVRYQQQHKMPLYKGSCSDPRWLPGCDGAFTMDDVIELAKDGALREDVMQYLRESIKWCRQHPREMWEDWQVELMQAVDK